jgi:acyl carrier protein
VVIDNALKLMQDSFDSMKRSGMMEEAFTVTPDSIILGTGSTLDSLGFVTFISDLEERVSDQTGKEHYLILTDIHEANADQAFLTAGVLAAYIENLTGR